MAIDRVQVNEGSAKTVTFTLRDNAGTVVPLANIDTATLTLYDLDTFAPNSSPQTGIVNDRLEQDVKNANDVTIHATSGLVTWAMQGEDAVIVTPRRQMERHRGCFIFVVDDIPLTYELEIDVLNLRSVA